MPEAKSRGKNSMFYRYYRNGQEVYVFEALETLPCYRCGNTIYPGDLFSRSASKDGKVPGIRYTFCRTCEPFEKQLALTINNSNHNEDKHSYEAPSSLAGYELLQVFADEHGDVAFIDQMGLPLSRHDVNWILRCAEQYLERNSDEDIERRWEQRIEELDNSSLSWAKRETRQKAKTAGYVYLISGGGYYKIGKTTNLQDRRKQIGLQLPFEVSLRHAIQAEDIDRLEIYWHERFAGKRLNGEWFALTAEDVADFESWQA